MWRGWTDDSRAVAFPVAKNGAYRDRFGAPYFGIHRADLQRVPGGMHGPERLQEWLQERLQERLHLGHRLIGISEHAHDNRLEFANGRIIEVDILIDADGIRSKVRGFVAGEVKLAVAH